MRRQLVMSCRTLHETGGYGQVWNRRGTVDPFYRSLFLFLWFARYGTFGAQKSGAALTYELSSAGEIVRWTWVRHKTYPVGLEPTLLPDEYTRQMEALLSLVAAKTGLAFYDLSGVRS